MVNRNNHGVGLVGPKQAMVREGFVSNGHCYSCGMDVRNGSHFCGRGHDNMLIDALLVNPASAEMMAEAIRAHLASGWGRPHAE